MKEFSPTYREGSYVEEGVLGKINREYQKDFEGENYEKHENYPIETLFELVKEFQPDADPSNPKKPFPKDLLETIGYLLGFTEFSKLSIYYALFNMFPISSLDGNKIFFGNIVLWSFLASLVVIGLLFMVFIV